MTFKPPPLILLSLAFISASAFATEPVAKTKKRAPQRPGYSAVDPFATKDPFATALKGSTSSTSHTAAQPAQITAPNYSNPYLNLNPKPPAHSGKNKN